MSNLAYDLYHNPGMVATSESQDGLRRGPESADFRRAREKPKACLHEVTATREIFNLFKCFKYPEKFSPLKYARGVGSI